VKFQVPIWLIKIKATMYHDLIVSHAFLHLMIHSNALYFLMSSADWCDDEGEFCYEVLVEFSHGIGNLNVPWILWW
jgi:hypothetical protein